MKEAMNDLEFSQGPRLSIILAVRNDNYGGDFIQRLENMLKWNIYFFELHKISTEFILVNYNPIPENPEIKSLVQLPPGRKYCTIRIISVPNSFHFQLSIVN